MIRHGRGAVLSIGDEITLGQKIDTNSGAIAAKLSERGVRIVEHCSVADDLDAIVGAIRRLAERCDLIISTGGLGPTADDLTRRGLAGAMGDELVVDDEAMARLESWAAQRQRTLSENQKLQALRPSRAEQLANANGTAPALLGRVGETDVLCLPGPPREMLPILERFFAERLRAGGGDVIRTRLIRVPALAEAEAAARLGELMSRDRNPLVGTTASGAVVDVRIRYEGAPGEADRLLEETERAVRRAVAPFDLPGEAQSLGEGIAHVLRERGLVLTTAESCTGGLIARRVTDVAGSSDVFCGGWVTYSNEMKVRELGVREATLAAHGAVSAQTAREMAEGALGRAAAAGVAVSVTGIAGPSGGSDDKPVGTVFVGIAQRGGTTVVRRFLFPGDRASVRHFTANVALAFVRLELLGETPERILGEVTGAG